MSKLQKYLDIIKSKDNSYLEEDNMNMHKFGFTINVKDEKSGETETHFIIGDTIDEFMDNMLKVVPDLAEESQAKIRKNLAELEKNVMN